MKFRGFSSGIYNLKTNGNEIGEVRILFCYAHGLEQSWKNNRKQIKIKLTLGWNEKLPA